VARSFGMAQQRSSLARSPKRREPVDQRVLEAVRHRSSTSAGRRRTTTGGLGSPSPVHVATRPRGAGEILCARTRRCSRLTARRRWPGRCVRDCAWPPRRCLSLSNFEGGRGSARAEAARQRWRATRARVQDSCAMRQEARRRSSPRTLEKGASALASRRSCSSAGLHPGHGPGRRSCQRRRSRAARRCARRV
jgi:hypothetical protein